MTWDSAFDGDDATYGSVGRTALGEWLGRDNGAVYTVTGWRFLQDQGPTHSTTDIRIWATDDDSLWTDACEAPGNGSDFDFNAAGWSEIEDITVGDGDFSGTFGTPFDARYVVAYSVSDTDATWRVNEFGLTSGSDEFCGNDCDHQHRAEDVVLSDGQTVQDWFDGGGGDPGPLPYVQTTGGGIEDIDIIADATAALTIDLAAGNGFPLTLTQDCAIDFTGFTAGKMCSILVPTYQDGTGGWDITWDTPVQWLGGVTPTPSTAASALNVYSFVSWDGGTNIYGVLLGA